MQSPPSEKPAAFDLNCVLGGSHTPKTIRAGKDSEQGFINTKVFEERGGGVEGGGETFCRKFLLPLPNASLFLKYLR